VEGGAQLLPAFIKKRIKTELRYIMFRIGLAALLLAGILTGCADDPTPSSSPAGETLVDAEMVADGGALADCETNNPCLNGATCLDGEEAVSCECTSDFQGLFCEESVGEEGDTTETTELSCPLQCEGMLAAGCDTPSFENVESCVTFCEESLADSNCGAELQGTFDCMGTDTTWVCVESVPGDPESPTTFAPEAEACEAPMLEWQRCVDKAAPCVEFCQVLDTHCTGDNSQDFGDEGCVPACQDWKAGLSGDTTGNSLACRMYHATEAESGDPGVHCPAAGLDGGSVCVTEDTSWCATACGQMAAGCPEGMEDSVEACTEECAGEGDDVCGAEWNQFVSCAVPTWAWECGEEGEPQLLNDTCATELEAFESCWETTDLNFCDVQPCENGGECSLTDDGYACACPDGFEGKNCEVNIEDCPAENPCQNEGTCVDGVASYTCDCIGGYWGETCGNDPDACHPSPCLNDGICSLGEAEGDYACACDDSWFGPTCQNAVGGVCDPNPCDGDSICAQVTDVCTIEGTCGQEACEGVTSATCTCQTAVCAIDAYCCSDIWDKFCVACAAGEAGFEGLDCSPVDGACTTDEPVAQCDCPEGTWGLNCEESVTPCEPFNPCLNGGECEGDGDGYTCDCSEGFTGEQCQENIDDCPTENPCQNGGVCVDGIASYGCACVDNYWGDMCENAPTACEPFNPCLNGGSCTVGVGVGAFTCACEAGWVGLTCKNIEGGVCDPSPCQNSGICTETTDACQEVNSCGDAECDVFAPNVGTSITCGCQSAVCNIDPFCCDSSWDSLCAACAGGGIGLAGANCEIAAEACSFDEPTPICSCVDGWGGDYCEDMSVSP